jgi:hypothetical protein
MCMDLVNDILHCQSWDPKILCSPHAEKISDPTLEPTNIEFKQAKSLLITLVIVSMESSIVSHFGMEFGDFGISCCFKGASDAVSSSM